MAVRGSVDVTAQDRYRQFFDESTAAQLVVGADGRVLEANRAAADLYGVDPAALKARTFASLCADDPAVVDDALGVAAAIGVHLSGIAQRHASGDVRLVELYGTPLHSDGDPQVHLIVHDITDRLRAQERERLFLAQIASLDAQQRTDTMARMGELVAGVAHEVRNPLFAISSGLDALGRRLGDHPDYQRYAGMLSAQVDRLSVLMEDLLQYGRPPALNVRAGDVRELLAAAHSVSTPIGEKAGVALKVNCLCQEGRTIAVDRFRFVQALQNLIVNAVQHSKEGTEVSVTAEDVGPGQVAFVVDDEGPGFNTAELPNVFEPFFTRRPGGTGLGLALVYRTVHDHGGSVVAENRTGTGGARVTIRVHQTPPISRQ